VKRTRNLLLLILVPLMLFQTANRNPQACAFEGWGPCFWFSSRAALDLEQFSRGYLGVIQPSWARSYLVVVYLTLDRGPLTGNARRQMLELWQRRLERRDYQGRSSSGEASSAVEEWRRVRNDASRRCGDIERIGNIKVFRAPEGSPSWRGYRNCGDDAFRNAVEVLSSFEEEGDENSGNICSWINAQDMVFSNCDGGPPSLPEVEEGLTPEMVRLRRYQRASALFYAEELDDAARAFREIADDPDSPWWDIGPHLVIRSFFRKAKIGSRELWADRREKARKALEELLEDPNRAGPTARAQRFLTFLEVRLLPLVAISELGQAILDQPPESTKLLELVDAYSTLLPDIDDEEAYGREGGTLHEDVMTRWIRLIRAGRRDNLDRSAKARREALDLWHRDAETLWLIPALMNSTNIDPATKELLRAAGKIPLSFPSGPTLFAERLRLKNSDPEIRAQARKAVRDRSIPWETRNFLASRLLETAGSFEETTGLLPRKIVCDLSFDEDLLKYVLPCNHSSGNDEPIPEYTLDCCGARLINFGLPLNRLQALVENADLEVSVRLEIARTAWTRAVLIGDHRHGVAIAGRLADLDRKLAGPLRRYADETSDADRARTALDILLWFPDLSPHVPLCYKPYGAMLPEDASHRNMWSPSWADPWPVIPPPFAPETPAWLDPEEVPVLQQELHALSGPAENIKLHHCRETLRWAEESPKDPRVPAALYRAVRATYFARASDEVGECSRRAFTILHRSYASSKWTKKTQYWYRGR